MPIETIRRIRENLVGELGGKLTTTERRFVRALLSLADDFITTNRLAQSVEETATKHFLTPSEAAKILKITPVSVRESIHRGSLPAIRRGRFYFIAEDDVRLWNPKKGPKKIR